MARDLVDEYRIFLHPLLLGTGKRLFREFPQPKPLRLTGSSTTTTGVLLLTYTGCSERILRCRSLSSPPGDAKGPN
jgi:dihydrofolate reductase